MLQSAALLSATTGELVAAVQRGDADAPSSFDSLVEKYEGFCRSIVARTWPANPHDEDLFQIARLGLVFAVRRFKASQKASFATFAWTVVRGFVIDEVRKRNAEARAFPVAEAPLSNDEPVMPDIFDHRLDLMSVKEAVLALSPSDRRLLASLSDEYKTQTQVAFELRVSHTAVYKRRKRILAALASARMISPASHRHPTT